MLPDRVSNPEPLTYDVRCPTDFAMLPCTTVRLRHGHLLPPTLINIFLKRIMSDALEEHGRRVNIGSRNIINLEFANDIDAQAEEEQELEALVESLDKTCTRHKMEISAKKTRLMTNSANGILREIKGRIWVLYKLHVPQSSCFRCWLQTRDSFSRIAQPTAAFTKLKPIWSDKNIAMDQR